MTEGNGVLSQTAKDRWMLVALAAISFATIITEIALTKFISYKLFYHFTYAIISLVMFSFGLAGVTVFLRPSKFGANSESHWWNAAQQAYSFSWTLCISVGLYCVLIMDNNHHLLPDFIRIGSYLLCVVLFALPFYQAGLSLSHILAATTKSLTLIYFVDLVAAAFGALVTPVLLESLGGYGTMLIASAAGLLGGYSLSKVGKPPSMKAQQCHWGLWLVSAILLFVFPTVCLSMTGCDIVSLKDPALGNFFNAYGGLGRTYWNAIARIDVSKSSKASVGYFGFSYGLSPLIKRDLSDLSGRYILVDGCANTRQLKLDSDLLQAKYLGTNLFATPYVAHGPTTKTLIIGAGGGIDIQVAKFFSVPQIDVVELNPSTYKLLVGEANDPERAVFVPQVQSNAASKVLIMNDEARHLCSRTAPGTYDVIHAGGVDTLAAIASGGMSLCENYLYTTDAVKIYYQLLKPDGVLSLTHWRRSPPQLGLKMFATYLRALEELGVKEPSKQVMCVAGDWTVNLLKTTPFTPADAERVRQWATGNGYEVLYDPTRTISQFVDPSEQIFQWIATANHDDRAKLIEAYTYNIIPTTDDNPYFYKTMKQSVDWQFTHTEDVNHNQLVVLAIFGVALLLLLPVNRAKGPKTMNVLSRFGPFFALSGFAFLLFETSLMQVLNIFVGGPLYSMAVTLVAVLGGYGVGSWLAKAFKPQAKFFGILGVLLCGLFVATYAFIVPGIHDLMSLPNEMRILVAVAITLALSIPTGMLVPMGAEVVSKIDKPSVAWMWGINSGFNVLGGVSYVGLSQCLGIKATFLVVAVFYLVAGLWVTARFPANAASNEAEAAASTH
jgi:hypothetical protein